MRDKRYTQERVGIGGIGGKSRECERVETDEGKHFMVNTEKLCVKCSNLVRRISGSDNV